jgi:site-specific DNA recombinase
VNYKRLERAGVAQVSVSEQFAKGSAGNLMRSMVTAFNQHFSEEAAKHTRRTMRANAALGFFNGGKAPFGYRSVTVAHYGNKAKKKLELDDAEAGLVRVMFSLATEGDGQGPLGVRAIATWLKDRGHTLKGGPFHNSNVADILARTHYVGWYWDGKKDDHGDPLPEAEWIRVPCPAIIDIETFEAAAALCRARLWRRSYRAQRQGWSISLLHVRTPR